MAIVIIPTYELVCIISVGLVPRRDCLPGLLIHSHVYVPINQALRSLLWDVYFEQGWVCAGALLGGSSGKKLPANAGDVGLTSGTRRSLGGGRGSPLQCSCLENPVDRGAWRATVCRVAKSWTPLKWHTHDSSKGKVDLHANSARPLEEPRLALSS